MAIIKSVKGLTPRWGKECYFSENAAIVGEVTMGDECSVWFNAVVRGDVAPVTMGNRVNVQDGAVVHVTNKIGPTIIEDDVTIGHNATVHACTLKRGSLIGMGSTVLDNAVVGEGAVNFRAEGGENLPELFAVRDGKAPLAGGVFRRERIEGEGKGAFEKLWQPRGKMGARGDDADLPRGEAVAVEQHAVALGHGVVLSLDPVTAQLFFCV